MRKSFSLKTLYDSSTVAQIAERFEPNTVFGHSTQYSHINNSLFILNKYTIISESKT